MPFRFRAGLGAKVLAFLGLCLVLGLMVGVWTLLQYRQVAETLARDSARRSGDFVETIKEQVVRSSFATLYAMSGFQRVQGMNPKDCHDVAAFFLQHSPGYSNIGSVTPDGKLYCSALNPPRPIDHSQSVWLKRALADGGFSVGDFQINPVTGKQAIMFSMPLRKPDGSYSQILFASLDTEYLRKLVRLPSLPKQASITVIDQAGHLLIQEPAGDVKAGDDISSWPIAKQGMSASKSFVTESGGVDGSRSFFAISNVYADPSSLPGDLRNPVKTMSFIIGIPARRDIAALLAPVQASGIAIGLVFAIILIGTYLFIGSTVVRPIEKIQGAAKRLTHGDLDARVKLKPSGDEIGALADAFNEMADTLARREAELRRSNARVQRILDTEPACVLIADGKLNILDINDAGVALFGAERKQELIGSSFRKFVTAEDMERFDRHFHAVRSGKTDSITLQISNLRNERRWIESHAAQINFDDGSGMTGIAIIRDKTDELETAAQLVQAQKMESVGRLTGGVAHDFNNLLTIMMGNAEVLAERLADRPELANLARMIEAAAQRGAELTHRMLAFARRQVLRPTELDVNTLLTRLVDMMGRILGEDIRIRIDTAEKLWCVAADPAQMESAILNLAINARDAMQQGGTLTIETRNTHLDEDYVARNPEASPGNYVLIAVSDSGAGMSADVLNRAFDPFFTTKEVGKGSGLGLSMVYGFVKQSQGHIKIYSEQEHGTTVRIYLPRSVGSLGTDDMSADAPFETVEGSETILVVEDEEAVRAYVTEQLRGLGYAVLEAQDARGALAILESDTAIDLLFTDVVLPGQMNGRQLAEIGQRLRPSLKVLFTTGYTENAVVHHGKLDAGVELLSKPYRRAELAQHIRKVIDKG